MKTPMQLETAIDWLLNNLPERYKNAMLTTCKEEIKGAKELFKTQIINAVDYGAERFGELGEEYYNHTYKQYGLDDEARDILNNYKGGHPEMKEI